MPTTHTNATVTATNAKRTMPAKGAVVAPTPNTSAAPAAPAVVGAGRGVPLQAITLLVPQCPKRPGTTCYKRAIAYWQAYAAAGCTTATAMAAGATAADLKWDAKHGFIALKAL